MEFGDALDDGMEYPIVYERMEWERSATLIARNEKVISSPPSILSFHLSMASTPPEASSVNSQVASVDHPLESHRWLELNASTH